MGANEKVEATFHGADSVAKGDPRYPTPEEEYAWAEGQRYDYLDVLRQRDVARAEVDRLTATLDHVRVLCNDPGGPDSWSHTFQGEPAIFVHDVLAAIGPAPADPDELPKCAANIGDGDVCRCLLPRGHDGTHACRHRVQP